MWTYKLQNNKLTIDGFFDIHFDDITEEQKDRAVFYAEKLVILLNQHWDENFNSSVFNEYILYMKNVRLKALSKLQNIGKLVKLTATDVVFEDSSGTKRSYKWQENDWVELTQ